MTICRRLTLPRVTCALSVCERPLQGVVWRRLSMFPMGKMWKRSRYTPLLAHR
jgi:hypothetical protein